MLSLGVRDIAAIVFVTALLAGILVACALHPRPLIQPSSLLSPEWDCATSNNYAEACVKNWQAKMSVACGSGRTRPDAEEHEASRLFPAFRRRQYLPHSWAVILVIIGFGAPPAIIGWVKARKRDTTA
jgi:hypothetical protein